MKNITEAFQALVLEENSSIPIMHALEIQHNGAGGTLYITNNTEDILINTVLYTAVGFDIKMPEESEDGMRDAKLKLSNADQYLTELIRSVQGTFNVTIRVVTPTDLTVTPPECDNVEYEFLPLAVTNIKYDTEVVELTLVYELLTQKSFPKFMYNATNFPGMF